VKLKQDWVIDKTKSFPKLQALRVSFNESITMSLMTRNPKTKNWISLPTKDQSRMNPERKHLRLRKMWSTSKSWQKQSESIKRKTPMEHVKNFLSVFELDTSIYQTSVSPLNRSHPHGSVYLYIHREMFANCRIYCTDSYRSIGVRLVDVPITQLAAYTGRKNSSSTW
jgi:hypothetical protein